MQQYSMVHEIFFNAGHGYGRIDTSMQPSTDQQKQN